MSKKTTLLWTKKMGGWNVYVWTAKRTLRDSETDKELDLQADVEREHLERMERYIAEREQGTQIRSRFSN